MCVYSMCAVCVYLNKCKREYACICVCVCVLVLLTEAAELAYDVGQGDVSHTFQLILDVPWQHRVAQVPGLDGALHQRHPSAATPLPTGVGGRGTGQTGKKEGRKE